MSFNVQENVTVGDIVFFAPHPGYGRYQAALVVFVGNDAIEVVVYSYNGAQASAEHRSGVRHESDPIWQDMQRSQSLIEDDDSGCFVLHPNTVALQSILGRLDDLEDGDRAPESAATGGGLAIRPPKKKKGQRDLPPALTPPVDPNKSFREPGPEAPPLTEEQRAARLAALADLDRN